MVIYCLATCCLLPKIQIMVSSFPVHSSRDQFCAKVTQAGIAGVVKISRCEDREFRCVAGLHAFPCSVLSLLNVLPLPVKS